MANKTGKTDPPQRVEQETAPLSESGEIPATRHVGRTLESDPAYYGVLQKGKPTVEAQIVADFRAEQAGALPADGVRQPDSEEPEPLITRLPGDTSSDPHTDLGPDNARNLHQR